MAQELDPVGEPSKRAGPVAEQHGVYVAARGYGSIADQNNIVFEDTFEVAAALGYRLSDSLRTELEYAWRSSDIAGLNGASTASGEFDSHSIGVHAYWDFRKNSHFRPFVGGGYGWGVQDFQFAGPADANPNFIVVADDRNDSLYWNALTGVTWHISSDYRLAFGVEYVSYSDQAVESNIGGIDGINRAYNFFLASRWFFGS